VDEGKGGAGLAECQSPCAEGNPSPEPVGKVAGQTPDATYFSASSVTNATPTKSAGDVLPNPAR